MNVYIVCGDTGEYSDHCAWYLKAFTGKAEADALCARLNAWCKERGYDVKASEYNDQKPEEDPQFRADYTGTAYSVMELPLEVAKDFNVRT